MKTMRIFSFVAVLLFVFSTGLASPQTQDSGAGITITMSRDFGYGGAGEIQGLFSIRVSQAPENVVRVAFFIDTTQIGEDSQAPFAFQFNTDNYPAGRREIYAIGYTGDGSDLASNKINVNFVSADAVPQKMLQIVGPLLAIIGLMIALGFILPMILDRRRGPVEPGTPRKYGLSGGTICSRCGRPYALHLFSLNLSFTGRLDRCPHCGKWALVRSRPLSELRQAEQAELEAAQEEPQIKGQTEEEKLRKELDDSRFQGG